MIKVDVVSGFLGAGKTTLVKKLLKAHAQEKVVLIENEFGEIGIDGDIIERDGFEVFEISSGCICCIMKKDFLGVLERIIEEFKPERIIIEPTGLSILSEIINILNSRTIADKCIINSLITVIDGVNYLEQREAFGEFFEDQIINAGLIIISKSQFIADETLEKIISSLRELNKSADIITEPWDKLSMEDARDMFQSNLEFDFKNLFFTEYKPCRENEFETLGIKTYKRFSKERLESLLAVLKEHEFGSVLRGKGFLKGAQGSLEFSYTNGIYEVKEIDYKTSGKMCFIGKNLNEKEIKKLFGAKFGGLFNW